jgi:hypothetical protein
MDILHDPLPDDLHPDDLHPDDLHPDDLHPAMLLGSYPCSLAIAGKIAHE